MDKTLLAKAVVKKAQSNFISIKGPELFNKYVGESEKGIRDVFSKARQNAPTVVFFDEIDAITSKRGRGVGDPTVDDAVTAVIGVSVNVESVSDVEGFRSVQVTPGELTRSRGI